MKKIIIYLALLFVVHIFSQDLPKITPPSPEATSLAKFTEVPVSHYTGLPTIEVPLYEINSNGLRIPIGLSYHARGIKVEEIASRVGIGWALNAGGTITRQIRGKDDFGSQGYLRKNFYKNFETNPTIRQNVYTSAINDDADLIPDQFTFSFLGYSGKFIFDQESKLPILQGFSDLKINLIESSNGNPYFMIETKDGFKFYFGNPKIPNTSREAKSKESSLPYMLTTSVATFPAIGNTVNTWHLIDIISPNGEKIHFNYEVENTEFHRRSYDKREIGGATSSSFSKINGTQYQLNEIIFDKGKIKFIKDNSPDGRQDLKGGYALSSIEVENKYERVKKYNFNYSYSINNKSSNINYYLFQNEIQARKRMFLDNIQIIDNNNNSQLYRSFEYTNKNSLPNRFSNEQDLWGYYNGKNNGSFLTNYNYNGITVNRKVDTIKASIGLIKKMTYPTGGYSSYIFEANRAKLPHYFKDLYFINPNPNPTIQSRYASLRKGIQTRVSYGIYESDFSILNSDIGPITIAVNFNGNVGVCSSTANLPNCKYRVSIVNANNTPLYIFSGPSYTIPLLPVGNYKIRVENITGTDDPNQLEPSFSVYLNWYKPKQFTPPSDLIFSGGNRIKTIENNSVRNGKITRTYDYLKIDGTSSGLVFSLPNYYYKKKVVTLVNGIQVPVLDQYGARPGSPLSYEQGNHVGYSRVIEYVDSSELKGSGGKTVYDFTAFPDSGKFYEFPYTLAVNNEWLRGKPLFIKYYKKDVNLNSYDIVKQEEFSYKYADKLSHGVLSDPYNLRVEPGEITPKMNYINDKLRFYRPLIKFRYNEYTSTPLGAENYKVYYLVGGVQKLYRKKETTYNPIGEISTVTDYKYDYENHYQVSGSEITNSQGKIIRTDNEYSILSNPFRVLPTRTKTQGENSKLSEHNTVYNNFGNLFLPQIIQTSKGSNPLEDRIIYHSYDDKGNPLEVSNADGTRIYYVWGYHQTQPIAKIVNLKSSDITTDLQNKINVAVLASTSDNDTCKVGCNEASLRNALKTIQDSSILNDSQMTYYTYDPLVGVTSITDTRGYTSYYEYDEFNRLKHVKDAQGNILSKTEYKYKSK